MDMNRIFYQRKEDAQPKWHFIDAQTEVLGRLSTRVADLLTGKGKATFAPHTDSGDYVVIINADKVKFSGTKIKTKIYTRVTGWIGGKKETLLEDMMKKDSTEVIRLAIKGMMPKNRLSDASLTRLKIYKHATHPHQGQETK